MVLTPKRCYPRLELWSCLDVSVLLPGSLWDAETDIWAIEFKYYRDFQCTSRLLPAPVNLQAFLEPPKLICDFCQ